MAVLRLRVAGNFGARARERNPRATSAMSWLPLRLERGRTEQAMKPCLPRRARDKHRELLL